MRRVHSPSSLAASTLALAVAFSAMAGCSTDVADDTNATSDELRGPGRKATDQRTPELGTDLSVLAASKITMGAAIAQAQRSSGTIIEAKFELDDAKHLSLSLYPVKDVTLDAQRNVFQELAGDPTQTRFSGALSVFHDQEHLTRSSRDLTLVQLSPLSLADAVARVAAAGNPVYWAIPTIRDGRAGYGVYTKTAASHRYTFVDGEGSDACTGDYPRDLGAGPGAKATDARTPELGTNLAVMRSAKITMDAALAQTEAKFGAAIEAKFELGDDGKLSLSIYPTAKGVRVDAERNGFSELAGDPTAAKFAPEKQDFAVPDEEHLTRSARDLTLVQTAGLSLRQAVQIAAAQIAGGIVYWAIPTIRDARSGYGVYVLGRDNRPHYFFVS